MQFSEESVARLRWTLCNKKSGTVNLKNIANKKGSHVSPVNTKLFKRQLSSAGDVVERVNRHLMATVNERYCVQATRRLHGRAFGIRTS